MQSHDLAIIFTIIISSLKITVKMHITFYYADAEWCLIHSHVPHGLIVTNYYCNEYELQLAMLEIFNKYYDRLKEAGIIS